MIITQSIQNLVQRIEADPHCSDAMIKRLLLELECSLNKHCKNDSLKKTDTNEPYPMDADGFARSFDPILQEEEFKNTWQRWGVVVGKGILSQEQCKETIGEIGKRVSGLSNGKFSLTNPSTWDYLPKDAQGTPLISRGFLEIYHDNLLAKIRQNVRAYLHHVLIWQDYKLWTSFDRIGVKLPAHKESQGLPLHVDQNPNVHPSFKTVQGVLALSSCPVERGTFLFVPGSRSFFHQYAGMAKNMGEYVELDPSSSFQQDFAARAQVIPLRAGDMVSWDSRITHANTANTSEQTRYVVYFSAAPARSEPQLVQARKDAFAFGLGSNQREAAMHASKKPRWTEPQEWSKHRQGENLNLLGKLLYGLEEYA